MYFLFELLILTMINHLSKIRVQTNNEQQITILARYLQTGGNALVYFKWQDQLPAILFCRHFMVVLFLKKTQSRFSCWICLYMLI